VESAIAAGFEMATNHLWEKGFEETRRGRILQAQKSGRSGKLPILRGKNELVSIGFLISKGRGRLIANVPNVPRGTCMTAEIAG
jgi:hypothetical protein